MRNDSAISRQWQVESLMAAMATGNTDALFTLLSMFRSDLEKTVRWILRDLGRSDVARADADREFLIQTAGLVLFDRAAGWQPGGALPWVWGRRAIRAELVRWLGHPRIELTPQHRSQAEPTSCSVELDLADIARSDDRIAEWLSAVEEVANDRDQKVHLEYQVQKNLGDPSPANTVARLFDLSPANVRQIDLRVRRRLGDRCSFLSATTPPAAS